MKCSPFNVIIKMKLQNHMSSQTVASAVHKNMYTHTRNYSMEVIGHILLLGLLPLMNTTILNVVLTYEKTTGWKYISIECQIFKNLLHSVQQYTHKTWNINVTRNGGMNHAFQLLSLPHIDEFLSKHLLSRWTYLDFRWHFFWSVIISPFL